MAKEKITHANIPLPKPEVHARHPFRNKDTHESLLQYLKERLVLDSANRDDRIARYTKIDREVAAWLELSDEDKKREIKKQKTGSPQATEVSLPLTWVHIDDMMTYYAQTFAPNRGMFYHTAGAEQSEVAQTLVSLFNNHAIMGSFYRHLLRSIYAIMKYNEGGLVTEWAEDYGPKVEAQPDGTVGIGSQKIFSGNKIKAVDMYNLLWDPSVDPTMIHKDGEWFATVELRNHYWLKNQCLQERFHNCEKVLNETDSPSIDSYYRDPPTEAKITSRGGSSGKVDWMAFMGGPDGSLRNNCFELLTMYIRINPNDFDLIPGNAQQKAARNRYEIWRFTICNGSTIIETTYMPNMHGHLPAYFGTVNDDFMRDGNKSPAEILNPLQNFSSFLLNTHVNASRKNLYGTTFYNPLAIDYDKIPAGEVAARVPIMPAGYDKDIRTLVFHDNNQLDTKQTMSDLEAMIGLINQFFPTQSLPSQIASIDRAVDSQVAAVQQGSNRRQHKGARLIDDTMMRPMRYSLYYNVLQFQDDGADIPNLFTGKSQKVDLSALRDSSIVDLIGQGLKALDRQNVANLLQQIIFALIQAPQAAQGIDILRLMDFWTSMMDIDTNMTAFALAPQEQPQTAQGDPAIGADGNPIVPANNPMRVTQPLYG